MKRILLFAVFGMITVLSVLISCQTENKTAHQNFISGKSNVLVCPVHILCNQESLYDTLISKEIVAYLNGENYANASFTKICPPANNVWSHNEAKMLTTSVDLFIEYVKNNPLPENTYILYLEFLKGGQDKKIIGIHYCVLNNKGEIAMKGLLNSAWDEFKKVNPKTDEDCFSVFKNGFDEKMKN